jgi:RNA polymerase sigma-70 factor (ECF subfamily)
MSPRPHTLSPRNPENDEELFRRVIGGDSGALEGLFHRYVDSLCSFAFAHTRSRDVAEEVVQDVFVWLWEHRATIEPPRSIASYLHGAVRNRALNVVRHETTALRINQRRARDSAPGATPRPFPAPDALAEAQDLRDALAQAVISMPLRCREAFILARTAHLTYSEIAVVLRISPKTVEIHLSRALAILRTRLASWRGE